MALVPSTILLAVQNDNFIRNSLEFRIQKILVRLVVFN